MTDKKWTQLPTVTNSTLNDIICYIQSGVSSQVTMQQVYDLILSKTILATPLDPNGHVAGKQYQLCWSLSETALFVCTTTGTSSTAVWEPAFPLPVTLTDGQLAICKPGDIPAP